MKKYIITGLTVMSILLSIVFGGKSALLNSGTVNALTGGVTVYGEWQNAGIPNSKTVEYTLDKDGNFYSPNIAVMTVSTGATIGGFADAIWALAAGASMTALGAGCLIVGGVICASEWISYSKRQQLNCCGSGSGVCSPFAPDKSDPRLCKEKGFLVSM